LDDVPAGAAGVVCGQMLGIEPEPSPYAVAAEAARRWAIRHGGAGGYRQGDQTGGREEECGELLQRRLLGGGTGSSFVLVFAAPCLSSHLAPRTQHRARSPTGTIPALPWRRATKRTKPTERAKTVSLRSGFST